MQNNLSYREALINSVPDSLESQNNEPILFNIKKLQRLSTFIQSGWFNDGEKKKQKVQNLIKIC